MDGLGRRRWALVLALALAAWLGDLLRLPFPYVPPTARLLPAIMAGAFLGPGSGGLSQGLFAGAVLAAAAAGVGEADSVRAALPPDLGYRLALPLAAAAAGHLAGPDRKATATRVLAGGLAALAIVDGLGVAALAWLLPPRLPQPIAASGILRVGVAFPLPWDLLQIAVAAALVPRLRRRAPWLAFPGKSP
ncbi:MAG TPA: biotin transporter BioY [Thermodesulfobacteriota bacterium]